jgi:uncharacterized radical SAM superfamily Fe-S cluster-containing enzyme
MGITKQELIDIISGQVQTVVMDKVQAFTDGWAEEFHKLVVQVMRSEEHNSLIISRMNTLEQTRDKIQSIETKLGQLVAVFEKGGLADRSNGVVTQFQEFLENRAETCPMRRRQRQWTPIVVALAAQLPVWIVLFLRLKLV